MARSRPGAAVGVAEGAALRLSAAMSLNDPLLPLNNDSLREVEFSVNGSVTPELHAPIHELVFRVVPNRRLKEIEGSADFRTLLAAQRALAIEERNLETVRDAFELAAGPAPDCKDAVAQERLPDQSINNVPQSLRPQAVQGYPGFRVELFVLGVTIGLRDSRRGLLSASSMTSRLAVEPSPVCRCLVAGLLSSKS